MTFDRLVLWIIYLSTVVFIWRSLSTRPKQWGWVILCSGLLGLSFGLSFLSTRLAAIVGGAIWTLTVLIPILGVRQINQWVKASRYRRA
ncbi:MAG: hypothetical protein ACLFM4_14965 [Phormidium sp.]